MRYLLLALMTAAAFAAAALGYYGPATVGHVAWVVSVMGWVLAAGAGLAALATPTASGLSVRGSRRPA
jgi:hypothetical protein